ncbi:MAG: phage antirepressor N-terminal domain-containing protein [Candidatus Promineifilaceae bacterium]|nr:phage antirepressor N-terminal domain-containing protein [Candidatus Promineifilaceae bacterium]
MSDSKALVPIEEKRVEFYEDKITVVLARLAEQNEVFVPIRPICDLLGVAWSAQRRRINRDPILSEMVTSVTVTVTEAGQRGDMLCLPLDYLNGWLFGINADRVKVEVRDQLLRYQRECYQVLSEAFQEGRLTADPAFEDLLAHDSPAAQAYKMASAIMKMARQQLMLESQLRAHSEQLVDHEQRLEEVEAVLGDPDRYISNAQASRISQAVKAVAMELSKTTGRNEYGGVYGELYRRFDVASYRELPASKYEEAMSWLREWYQQLTDHDLPF